MKRNRFDELVRSVREGGEILRGERAPSRAFPSPTPSRAEPPHSVQAHPYLKLADRLAQARDPEEQSHLKEELARMTFGE